MSNIIVCKEHGSIKRYLVCLIKECKTKLLCYQCHQDTNGHQNQDWDTAIDKIITSSRN